jgi:LysM repeat protein
MVDGSHITFSASGTALTELMQNEGFELADSTDYIQEANSGYFESFDASSFGAADYEIQSGDTLSEIAEANGTSVAHIMELNPDIADPNVIFAGDNILLPQNDVVSGPYDGWRPEWSESSSDFESLETETYNVTGESDYSDSYEAAYSEEGYDSTDEQTDSTNYDSVDWESFEDQPVDDYSSYLGQEDFASYDSPDSYYDSGEMNGFDFI